MLLTVEADGGWEKVGGGGCPAAESDGAGLKSNELSNGGDGGVGAAE